MTANNNNHNQQHHSHPTPTTMLHPWHPHCLPQKPHTRRGWQWWCTTSSLSRVCASPGKPTWALPQPPSHNASRCHVTDNQTTNEQQMTQHNTSHLSSSDWHKTTAEDWLDNSTVTTWHADDNSLEVREEPALPKGLQPPTPLFTWQNPTQPPSPTPYTSIAMSPTPYSTIATSPCPTAPTTTAHPNNNNNVAMPHHQPGGWQATSPNVGTYTFLLKTSPLQALACSIM